MAIPFAPVEIFYSFAEADAPLLEQLEQHLSVLRHQGQITTWHKRQIAAGQDWQHELDQHLNAASLILLLISPDFLVSDYQYGVELQRAIQRHDQHEARVIPIALRPCDWKGAPFEKLQMIPRNGTPLTLWRNRDAGFTEVAKEIRTALETIPSLTAHTSATELPKIWHLPYPRNPVFTGREDLLQTLTEAFQTDHAAGLAQPRTQALSGLGGVGKTQVAVEYAYRNMRKYQAVFWVRAESTEALIAGYGEMAHMLHLPQRDGQDQSIIVQAVQTWLQRQRGWLLVLDNADDLALMRSFLPPTYGGHILLTTRAQTMGRLAQRIEVDPLDVDLGALLLLRRADLVAVDASLDAASPSDQTLAKAITQELGGLPLALDQAGAYIEETQCGLVAYQRQYQTRRAELLAMRGGLVDDHPEPVATTWSISFAKVKAASPLAAELLQICAFLAPDAIPEELLEEALKRPLPASEASGPADEEGEGLSRLISGQRNIDETVALLRSYSLLQRNAPEKMVRVHRLVQAVVRDMIQEQEQVARITNIISAVEALFPWGDFENWGQCERYLPQVLVCAKWMGEKQLLLSDGAKVCYSAGYYLSSRALYNDAEPLYKRALHIWEQSLGPEHPQVAYPLNNLALLYKEQGKYEQAESLYKRALHIWEQSLGPEHPQVAYPLNNLGELYREQGKYEQVESLYERALSIWEQSLGPEHPQVAYPLNNLAILYQRQEKYEQAESLYKRALTIRERNLGPEHPQVASLLTNLATFYQEQDLKKSSYERVVNSRKQSLGPEHPDAESLYKRALHIREQSLGPEHPDIAYTLTNLAILYHQQSKCEQAESLYKRALHIREQSLGPEHPQVAYILNNLAALYMIPYKGYKLAEPLFKQALHILEGSLGPEHPDLFYPINNLAFLHRKYGMSWSMGSEGSLLLEQASHIAHSLGGKASQVAHRLGTHTFLYQEQGTRPMFWYQGRSSFCLLTPEHLIHQ